LSFSPPSLGANAFFALACRLQTLQLQGHNRGFGRTNAGGTPRRLAGLASFGGRRDDRAQVPIVATWRSQFKEKAFHLD